MSNTAKVGAFMAVALVVLAVLIFKIEDLRLWGGDAQRAEAVFDSVAGLDDKAAVRVAGVRVGRVDGIHLEARRAVVGLLFDEPMVLRQGASATISSLGLLGDKFVDLDPGDPAAMPLAEGERLPGQTPVAWDDAIAQLSSLGTSLGDTLAALDPQKSGETISRLLANLEATSATVQTLVEANRQQVGETIANFDRFSSSLADELPRLTAQMEAVLTQVEAVITDNRGALRETLDHVAEVSGGLRSSIDDLNRITGQIAAGQGTLGKLIGSSEMHDQLTSTLDAVETGVESLTDTFSRVQKMRLDLGFDSYVLEDTHDARSAFSIDLDPQRSNRFYRIGVVDDPRGRTRQRTDVVTVTAPDGSMETTSTTTRSVEQDLTVSAQFGFRFGDARLRAGLFESSGGAAVDYGFRDDRVRMSLEAFDFSRLDDLDPHFRLFGEWRVHPNIYLLGGVDDFLVDDLRSLFLGVGVRWNDDDLKYLLGSLPKGSL
jgi:phospholipid/cholesterol/gamma-HCH transport system substrate-binding protein